MSGEVQTAWAKSLRLAAGTWLRLVTTPGPGRVSPTASPGSANRRAGEETLRARPPDRHAAGPEAGPRLASRLAATPALRRNGAGRSTPIWLICAPRPSRPKTQQDTL